MKKILGGILLGVFALSFGLAACSKKNNAAKEPEKTDTGTGDTGTGTGTGPTYGTEAPPAP